jgi:uncharacterized Zn-binding protein involved in type VI secretion
MGDGHVCPKVEASTKVPHVGGPGGLPTPPMSLTVLVNGLPILVVGDAAFCVGPPDTIVEGIDSVQIGGKLAANSAAATDHGGRFVVCSTDVLIR